MADPLIISILVTSVGTLLAQLFSSVRSNHFTSSCCKDENGKSCLSMEVQTDFKENEKKE
jgi:hypothetical protein